MECSLRRFPSDRPFAPFSNQLWIGSRAFIDYSLPACQIFQIYVSLMDYFNFVAPTGIASFMRNYHELSAALGTRGEVAFMS